MDMCVSDAFQASYSPWGRYGAGRRKVFDADRNFSNFVLAQRPMERATHGSWLRSTGRYREKSQANIRADLALTNPWGGWLSSRRVRAINLAGLERGQAGLY
jgi:hypothetical protein